MKKTIILIALATFALQSKAQKLHTTADTTHHKVQGSMGDPNADINVDIDSPVKVPASVDPNQIYAAVEQEPKFSGGPPALNKFLHENIKNPNNVLGKVIVTFVVEKDGGLTDIKILRSPAEDVSAETTRVLKLCPKWNPGVQNGKAVRVQYTIAIALGN